MACDLETKRERQLVLDIEDRREVVSLQEAFLQFRKKKQVQVFFLRLCYVSYLSFPSRMSSVLGLQLNSRVLCNGSNQIT